MDRRFCDDIDLDLSLCDLDHLNRPGPATSAFSYLSQAEPINLEHLRELEDETDDEILFGSLRTNIVGVQYYHGMANDGEMVTLEREPTNRYDPNAVKVNNMDGIQVGHIKRELASALAEVMDNKLARVEGVVPFCTTNMFTIPIDLTLWGKREDKDLALSKLTTLGFQPRPTKEEPMPSTSSAGNLAGFDSVLRTTQGFLTAAEVKEELDKMEGDKTTEAEPAQMDQRFCDDIDLDLSLFDLGHLNRHGPATSAFSYLSQPEPINPEHLNELEEETDDEILFGSLRTNIVGVQYYHGTVNDGEMVSLEREPTNHYDPNAVKVNNMDGIQVGHIMRELASVLADIMDNKLARVEGVVSFSTTNMFTMPVDLTLWGRRRDKDITLSKLTVVGFQPRQTREESLPSTSSGGNLAGFNSVLDTRRVFLSPAEVKGELDKLFDNLKEGDKTTEAEPAQAIVTKMYPHQKQALHWMMTQENDDALPPFWEKRGNKYYNSVTVFSTHNKPRSVHGGILADDMGLGKTLEMIALILTNFHNGKALAIPVPGVMGEAKKNMKRTKPVTAEKKSPDTPGIEASRVKLDLRKKLKMSENLKDMSAEKPLPPKPSIHFECDHTCSSGSDDEEYATAMGSKQTKSTGANHASGSKKVAMESLTLPQVPKPGRSVPNFMDLCVEDELPDVCCVDHDGDHDDLSAGAGPSGAQSSSTVSCGTFSSGVSSGVSPGAMSGVAPSPSSGRTPSDGPRGTLIICPLSVMSNWMHQLKEHVHPNVKLEMYMYYGSNRIRDAEFLSRQDVVLTTYPTVAKDYKHIDTRERSQDRHPLRAVEWLRIVLDEGHAIRNPSTLQTMAVMDLRASRKWVLTGTPIQNSMKDLWSIVNFLEISPFTDIHWWHRTIERPLSTGDYCALQRVRQLMGTIALRRTKTQEVNGKLLLDLPEKLIFVEHIKLSDEERKLYDSLQNNGQLFICRYFNEGTLLQHYGEVLTILLRLRQLCCHPKLIEKGDPMAAQAVDRAQDEEKQRLVTILLEVLQSGCDEECSVCLDSLRDAVITPCGHVYCRECIKAIIKNEQPQARCPLCREDLKTEQLIAVPPEAETPQKQTFSDGDWQSSSKVDALMNTLITLRQQDPSVKSLVVSQFTSLLQLLEIPLRKQGFVFTKLVGTMSASQRVQSIAKFSEAGPETPSIMLLSLKAGGVGINLTAASQVFLMDPAWNPASEEQCFDRCHRLGQTKDVTVTKFVIEDSVEERMLQLQEMKRKLMHCAFGKKPNAEQRRQQKINDIRKLIIF